MKRCHYRARSRGCKETKGLQGGRAVPRRQGLSEGMGRTTQNLTQKMKKPKNPWEKPKKPKKPKLSKDGLEQDGLRPSLLSFVFCFLFFVFPMVFCFFHFLCWFCVVRPLPSLSSCLPACLEPSVSMEHLIAPCLALDSGTIEASCPLPFRA